MNRFQISKWFFFVTSWRHHVIFCSSIVVTKKCNSVDRRRAFFFANFFFNFVLSIDEWKSWNGEKRQISIDFVRYFFVYFVVQFQSFAWMRRVAMHRKKTGKWKKWKSKKKTHASTDTTKRSFFPLCLCVFHLSENSKYLFVHENHLFILPFHILGVVQFASGQFSVFILSCGRHTHILTWTHVCGFDKRRHIDFNSDDTRFILTDIHSTRRHTLRSTFCTCQCSVSISLFYCFSLLIFVFVFKKPVVVVDANAVVVVAIAALAVVIVSIAFLSRLFNWKSVRFSCCHCLSCIHYQINWTESSEK